MAVKIFGSILLMIGITGIGMSFAMKEKFRYDNLTEIKRNINLLMSELLYNKSLFYNAVEKIAENSGELNGVYKEVLKGLDNNNSVLLSWKFAFEKYKNELYINSDELGTILGLGEVFSSPDYNYQKTEITSVIDFLDKNIAQAKEKAEKDKKLYRSISVSIAAFVVILLF